MPRRRPPAERPRRRGLSRRALIVVAGLAVTVAALTGARWWSRDRAASLLPDPPPTAGLPDALVHHVTDADRAARRAPADAAAVGALGMAYHADLFYDHAAAAYTRAAALDAADWRWTYYRALLELERGQAARAVEDLRVVVGARPGFALGWWRLGEAAFKQADYDEADAAFVRAEGAATTGPAAADVAAYARTGRARTALHRGDAVGAERTLAGVIAADPRFGPAHRVMADTMRALGRAADADAHAARAAALRAYTAPHDPLVEELAAVSRSPVFLLRYAASLDLTRDGVRRERAVRQALASDPDNPDVVYEMGLLLQQLRRPADALPYFVQHLALTGGEAQTLVQLGKVYTDLGRLDEAETALRRSLAEGDDAVGFYNLGLVLEQRGRDGEAESHYRRAIAVNPGLASAHNNLGSLLARRGRTADAAGHLRESIRLDPGSPDAYTNLAAVHLARGEVEDAAGAARQAIAADARHADAYVNLGVALARQGDVAGALGQFERALAIDPTHPGARANRDALRR